MDWGTTPPPRNSPLGSILTPTAASAKLNFTSDAAAELYRRRRLDGWGLDPVRCESYLTSSQALTLNLFGPLISDMRWFAEVLKVVLRREIVTVLNVMIEYAPTRPSEFLNDRTRADVLVSIDGGDAVEVVVIETKYSDRFNSRVVAIADNANFWRLAGQYGVWSDPDVSFRNPRMNQLVRIHALAQGYLERSAPGSDRTTLLVIRDGGDSEAAALVKEYADCVSQRERVIDCTVRDFIEAMELTGREHETGTRALRIRYSEIERSETDYVALNDERAKNQLANADPSAALEEMQHSLSNENAKEVKRD